MNFRHAGAALALMGWYLMVLPQDIAGGHFRSAPLGSEWKHQGDFSTLNLIAITQLQKDASVSLRMARSYAAVRCAIRDAFRPTIRASRESRMKHPPIRIKRLNCGSP